MIKLRILAVVGALCGAVVGGASISSCRPGVVVPPNAIAIAQTVSATAQAIVNDAQVVWPAIEATIPTASQATAQDAFTKAVFTANHVILTLNDAIRLAAATNTLDPDFTAIFSELADAVAQIVSIVHDFQTVSPDGGVDVASDMNDTVMHLREAAKK